MLIEKLKGLVRKIAFFKPIRKVLIYLNRNKTAILYMHRVDEPGNGVEGIDITFLKKSIQLLKNEGFNFISLEQVVSSVRCGEKVPPNSICITIDDGFYEQALVAAATLESLEVPVTIFLITDFTEGLDWPWFEKVKYMFHKSQKDQLFLEIFGYLLSFDLSKETRREAARRCNRFLKRLPKVDLLRAIEQLSINTGVVIPDIPPGSAKPITWDIASNFESEFVRFAPHCMSHINFSRLSSSEAESELSISWMKLKENLRNPQPIFCFPNGRKDEDFLERDVVLSKQAGYVAVLSTNEDYTEINQKNKYVFHRISYPSDWIGVYKLETKIDYLRIKWGLKVDKRIKDLYGSRKGLLSHFSSRFATAVSLNNVYRNVQWDEVKRLIFICKGNVCRSAFAEAIAKTKRIDAMSYGVDTTTGKWANIDSISVADQIGVDLRSHRTKHIKDYVPVEGDLIVAMEPSHLKALEKMSYEHVTLQYTLLGLWSNKFKSSLIYDPYGCSQEYFRNCFRLVKECVDEIGLLLEKGL